MSIADRKTREKRAVKDLILKASWNIVKREGWQGLSMRKIADAIEYSAPVIYSHFANKEAIMQEFTRQGFLKLNKALKKAAAKEDSPEDQVEALAVTYLRFAAKNKEYYQLMYGLGIPACQIVQETPELAAFTEIILAPVKHMISKRKGPKPDPVTKLQAFWAMLHGLVSIDRMNKGNQDELNKRVVKDFVCNFIAGIKK